MLSDPLDRLVTLVRRPDADLAEAALLCAAQVEPELDLEVELLRVEALTDGLRSRGFDPSDPGRAAGHLAGYLADELGFLGGHAPGPDPDASLLHRVLTTRRGLPLTLSIVYVAIAQRLRLPAYPIALPGHVVMAIAGRERPIVLDPYHGGTALDEPGVASLVAAVTGERVAFRRSMLRPAASVDVVRRLCNNLGRDLRAADRLRDALAIVELKLALPNRLPEDHRLQGELLTATGRFDAAAAAFERYLEVTGPDAPGREAARRSAIDARARMN
jgi:regulator of sirC expression with transglutaminase-like and TPR domain